MEDSLARPPAEHRFADLLRAGLTTIGRKGLHRTRMAEIAAEAGVSPGTLYNYFESKEALFFTLVDTALEDGVQAPPDTLPVTAPDPKRLMERVRDQLARHYRVEALDEALAVDRSPDAGTEVRAIVGELFDLTASTRLWVDALERSAADMPELAALFVSGVRHDLFQRVERWIRARQAAGQHHAELDPAASARIVVESITYLARHRHRDPDPPATPEPALRSTVQDALAHALVC